MLVLASVFLKGSCFRFEIKGNVINSTNASVNFNNENDIIFEDTLVTLDVAVLHFVNIIFQLNEIYTYLLVILVFNLLKCIIPLSNKVLVYVLIFSIYIQIHTIQQYIVCSETLMAYFFLKI